MSMMHALSISSLLSSFMDTPLLPPSTPTTTPTSPSTTKILTHLTTLLLLTLLSLLSTLLHSPHPFPLTILPSPLPSPAARRFHLSFLSTSRAAHLLLSTTHRLHLLLHPSPSFPQKPIRHLTLQLSPYNLSAPVLARPGSEPDTYLISLNPTLFSTKDFREAVESAVREGVARVLLWDGGGAAPAAVLDAMVEFLLSGSDLGKDPIRGPCWADAGFLRYCDEKRVGFVARLNRGLKEGWEESAVEEALGMPVGRLCEEYRRVSLESEEVE